MRRIVFALFVLAALPAFGRTLYWRSVNVDATLDKNGRLRVVERQQMVFDGDWNGGERTWDLRPSHSLSVRRMARVRDGQEVPMRRGNLENVDDWQAVNKHTLRWRSRLPSDPSFSNEEITYIIEYTMKGIVLPRKDVYLLDHEFAFPDRTGVIERFDVRVTFDPVWGVAEPLTHSVMNVAPGSGVRLRRQLRYSGAGTPSAVAARPKGPVEVGRVIHPDTPKWAVRAVPFALVGGAILLVVLFVRAERAVGRLAPLTPLEEIDERWLSEHVFGMKPEVAGFVLDGKVGAPEVAAVLARMTQEKKIESRVEKKTLHMKLLVPRSTLQGYERALVARLFYSDDETNTKAIKDHYRSTGFDPASEIESGLTALASAMESWSKSHRRFHGPRNTALGIIAVALLLASTWTSGANGSTVVLTLILGIAGGVAAFAIAHANRNAASALGWRTAGLILPLVPAALLVSFAGTWWAVGPWTLGAAVLLILTALKLALDLFKTTERPEQVVLRRQLASARRWFVAELQSGSPRLRDEWYPYLLAFGLGKHVDRWFRAHGEEARVSGGTWGSDSSSTVSSSTVSSPGASTWTGGGGAFGGAGASVSWGVAAGAMAAGVSAPASSGSSSGWSSSGGSSSGGGGGGSSSGGGGGGGW